MTTIKLANFKCFRKLRLPIKRLNILAGVNGSGKSSVFQSILFLKQTLEHNDVACLNGAHVELGTVDDVACFYSDGPTRVGMSSGTSEYSAEYGAKGWVTGMRGGADSPKRFLRKAEYLSADRYGPRLHSPVPDTDEIHSVGQFGEFTAAVLARNSDRKVPRSLKPPIPDLSSNVLEQVSAWMSLISPGVRIEAQEVEAIRAAYHYVSFEYDDDRTPNFKPNMVGFGISYALPIVVAVLCSAPHTILMIENPEAHLHPAGQSALGRFLARAAATDLRIMVETHSDHFLNGMRLEVKEGTLSPSLVLVSYFYKDEQGHSEVTSLKVKSGGEIADWPTGFFDQGVKDLLALA